MLRFKSEKEAADFLQSRGLRLPEPNRIEKRKLKGQTKIGASSPKKGFGSSPPHDILWGLVLDVLIDFGPVREFEGAVEGRRFRLDIAFPSCKLCVEVDGWQFHGKYKSAFIQDRIKQNLLVENGWRVLRFTAGQIFKEKEKVLTQITKALQTNDSADD